MTIDFDTAVLVAVINNLADWRRLEQEHWYRIPLKHAPRHMTAQIIAWYQTSAFGANGKMIRWYAPIEQSRIVTRRELLPDQAEHPRANERYWQIRVGQLQQLARPIPATTFKRVTFIPTRWERLLYAQSINDLWLADAVFAHMCQQLEAEGYSLAQRRLGENSQANHAKPMIKLHATLAGMIIQAGDAELRLDWSDLIWQEQQCLGQIRAFLGDRGVDDRR